MQDFSLIILCQSSPHLLSSTLDSLRMQQGNFEVILLNSASGKGEDWAKSHPELKIKMREEKGRNLAQMMNLGLQMAEGKYVQFMQPGDRYISQHGLSFLTEQMSQHPPFIEARGKTEQDHSFWFLKEKVLELGGLDERLHFVPLQDLLFRFKNQKIEPLTCNRVLIDSMGTQPHSVSETCKIIYRNFGLSYLIKWIFIQDRSQFFSRARAFLKESFWQD